VLEAMKMENEIQVEHPGVLKRLAVVVGQAVEAGDLLFEME
jgi:biotin carboxyl carrier protein